MLRYVVRRLVLMIPILFGLSIVVFVFIHALPGDPADALLGERGSAEQEERIREQLGLDRPLPVQYARYMQNVFSGDLGSSVRTRRPVSTELANRFPATVELSLAAMIFAIGVGVPLGFIAAKRYRGFFDNASLVGSLIGISFPIFFLALLLKYVFAVKLGWLPTVGRIDVTRSLEHPTGFYMLDAIIAGDGAALVDVLKHLIMPAI